jgi:hypothetical protein
MELLSINDRSDNQFTPSRLPSSVAQSVFENEASPEERVRGCSMQ